MSSSHQGTYSKSMNSMSSMNSMPLSPPPPPDLGTYARFMHQHTKRQMESISSHSPPRNPGGASQHDINGSDPTGLPGGVSSSTASASNRNRNSSQHS